MSGVSSHIQNSEHRGVRGAYGLSEGTVSQFNTQGDRCAYFLSGVDIMGIMCHRVKVSGAAILSCGFQCD